MRSYDGLFYGHIGLRVRVWEMCVRVFVCESHVGCWPSMLSVASHYCQGSGLAVRAVFILEVGRKQAKALDHELTKMLSLPLNIYKCLCHQQHVCSNACVRMC